MDSFFFAFPTMLCELKICSARTKGQRDSSREQFLPSRPIGATGTMPSSHVSTVNILDASLAVPILSKISALAKCR
jgi:acid phosphatase family membrane protein YuiD